MDRITIDHRKINLRQLQPKDITKAYVDWLNDPEVNKYLEIRHQTPITREDVIKFVNNCNSTKRYHWGIFYDDQHIGNISCSKVNNIYNWVNISNLIGEKKYWNSNMAKLSLNGAMNYLFNSHYNRIEAGTYSVHLSGITLLTNLGFKKEGVLKEGAIVNNKYVDILLFAITKKEWEVRENTLPFVNVERPLWE